MEVLVIKNLTKEYPKFTLSDVSFSARKGRIMGLIGRNGAGKSTTIKAILNIIRSTSGSVKCFDMDIKDSEEDIKQRIGFAAGTVDYYKKKKLSEIIDITKSFYKNWDDETCEKYLKIFSLDTDKTPSQLSEGMKVKFSLLLALSHRAELLILDEPTSGLDPVSRDELLEIFKYLKSQGATILFSTHITSDLEKCADDITYIKSGKVKYTGDIKEFIAQGIKENRGTTLEEIMISWEKEALYESFDQ